MKFYKRLYENEKIFEEIKDFLSKNCQPVIKEFKGKRTEYLPYIGKKQVNHYEVKKTRKNRRPKDSTDMIHDFFDEQFDKHYGIRGRSECIFVTGDNKEAANYGPVNIVLPIGDYNILWSPDINDLWGKFEHDYDLHMYISGDYDVIREWIWDDVYGDHGAEEEDEEDEEELVQIVGAKMQEWEDQQEETIDYIIRSYKTKNFIKALESHNEIMLECDHYVLIDPIYEEKIKQWLDIR